MAFAIPSGNARQARSAQPRGRAGMTWFPFLELVMRIPYAAQTKRLTASYTALQTCPRYRYLQGVVEPLIFYTYSEHRGCVTVFKIWLAVEDID